MQALTVESSPMQGWFRSAEATVLPLATTQPYTRIAGALFEFLYVNIDADRMHVVQAETPFVLVRSLP